MAPQLAAQTLLLISFLLATYRPAPGRSLIMIEAYRSPDTAVVRTGSEDFPGMHSEQADI